MKWMVSLLLLSGCTMQTELTIRCHGDCSVEFERGLDTKAPSPDLPVPKLQLSKELH